MFSFFKQSANLIQKQNMGLSLSFKQYIPSAVPIDFQFWQ